MATVSRHQSRIFVTCPWRILSNMYKRHSNNVNLKVNVINWKFDLLIWLIILVNTLHTGKWVLFQKNLLSELNVDVLFFRAGDTKPIKKESSRAPSKSLLSKSNAESLNKYGMISDEVTESEWVSEWKREREREREGREKERDGLINTYLDR